MAMWKIFASLRIYRPAVLSKTLSAFEERVSNLYSELEVQNSHLSAHEKRHELDAKRMSRAPRPQESSSIPKSEEKESLLTAKDMELAWEAEMAAFQKLRKNLQLGDKADVTTAWRKLDTNLTLFTCQTLGNCKNWGLPVIEVTENHTLRSAADLLASKLLPSEAKCKIFGNTPVAVHKYHYRTADGEKQGVQMYFLNAYVDKLWRGETVCLPDKSDFAWLSRDEFDTYISDRHYLRRLRSFIVDY
ncbi:unnamed protein product [Schistocephalus solidus]|uniref:MRP-L46 domain-containing protein n=1 Tax=Schistocephalus solidus TaxID=70667 RepID=A0A183ST33_SCHSO|nr:unnamed protein product [Schistocephalus solidus]